jgi:hypothetical protein
MRYLSAGLLLVILIFYPSCKFFKGSKLSGKEQKALVELHARQDSIRVADSIRKVQERLIAIENAKIDSLKKADEERLARERKYNIIVGSFISHEYANDLADSYRKKGYDAQVLKIAESKFELVAAEVHNSFNEAVKRLSAFQDTVLIDAWLFIRK